MARMEARRLGHRYLGPEHLLLGLLQGDNPAARVLADHGLDLEAVHARVQEAFGEHAYWEAVQRVQHRRAQAVTHAPIVRTDPSPLLCGRALRVAHDEAVARDQEVGPEHLLMGLLGEARGTTWSGCARRCSRSSTEQGNAGAGPPSRCVRRMVPVRRGPPPHRAAARRLRFSPTFCDQLRAAMPAAAPP
jgi:ATP-dependent Clp protease ATP-binding subunit ClpA